MGYILLKAICQALSWVAGAGEVMGLRACYAGDTALLWARCCSQNKTYSMLTYCMSFLELQVTRHTHSKLYEASPLGFLSANTACRASTFQGSVVCKDALQPERGCVS